MSLLVGHLTGFLGVGRARLTANSETALKYDELVLAVKYQALLVSLLACVLSFLKECLGDFASIYVDTGG